MSDNATARRPPTIYLRDYRPPPFVAETVELRFDLYEDHALVTARTRYARAPGAGLDVPLRLDGHDLVLESVAIDGRMLTPADYLMDGERLTVPPVPDAFSLEVVTRLRPQENTALEGLYKSGGNFCTQCEAEGFRRITYFQDRPDVLARYTTTISADTARYPVLLSNGNCVARGEGEGGRHWARYEDPFPKPCYLFALVAGDLACIVDRFTTRSGRAVALRIFVQHHNADQCDHAMRSLKNAMKWDEDRYGREYDLDTYMIVAVDDFNMGAMENKGLNIFNSRYVLARPETATDADFQAIEAVIGHEYFHNWSGNRVTCRDWFQLSLKEGFTVFRDQQFSAELGSRAVKRIADANLLRTHQFREDAGPMAHPVRPFSYVMINNFYTFTVYNKGAELIRMLHTLLGEALFRKGTDVYFARHDGQAVTTDDFVRAMEDASGRDLTQFRRWYTQAGTPVLRVERHYDAARRTFTLTLRQECGPSPGQPSKEPFHIPVRIGLLDEAGAELPLQLAGETAAGATQRVLELTSGHAAFEFVNVPHEPVPSLLREFSAPVKLDTDLSESERCFLMAHDSDWFNRWDCAQQLGVANALRIVASMGSGEAPQVDQEYVRAMGRALSNEALDEAFVAHMLALPSEAYIAEAMETIEPQAIHAGCMHIRQTLARELRDAFAQRLESLQDQGGYEIDARSIGRRALKNACLGYLMELGEPEVRAHCLRQFRSRGNMTDTLAALTFLANTRGAERDVVLQEFYERWRADALVLDKWFAIQAGSRLPDTFERVQGLVRHPDFSVRNPNRARSVIGVFTQGNPAQFHRATGDGYRFLADHVLSIDAANPQLAARFASGFSQWRRYDAQRSKLMRAELERIVANPALSKDTFEIVTKTLA
jgi:aminopeptidase N